MTILVSPRARLMLSFLAAGFFGAVHAETRIVHHYPLGEADVGSRVGWVGLPQTADLGRSPRPLERVGKPGYSSVAAPTAGSTLAMRFVPGNQSGFLAQKPALTASDNFGFQVWVKARTAAGSGEGRRLVVYNGFPLANGFGFRQTPTHYELVFTKHQTIAATPAPLGRWVHLAYVRAGGVNRFFVNGQEVPARQIAPLRPDGKTMVGATGMDQPSGELMTGHFFDGWIDEVKIFTFKRGRFDPARDLDFSAQ